MEKQRNNRSEIKMVQAKEQEVRNTDFSANSCIVLTSPFSYGDLISLLKNSLMRFRKGVSSSPFLSHSAPTPCVRSLTLDTSKGTSSPHSVRQWSATVRSHLDNTAELVLLLRRMAPMSRSALSDVEVDGRHDGTLYTSSCLRVRGVSFLLAVWLGGAFRSLQQQHVASLHAALTYTCTDTRPHKTATERNASKRHIATDNILYGTQI